MGVKSVKMRLANTYVATEAAGKDEICRCKWVRAEARAASVEREPSEPSLSLNITTLSFRPPLGYFLSLCLAFNPAEVPIATLIPKASLILHSPESC